MTNSVSQDAELQDIAGVRYALQREADANRGQVACKSRRLATSPRTPTILSRH